LVHPPIVPLFLKWLSSPASPARLDVDLSTEGQRRQ
jgi:hypothetical protein